MGDRRCSAFAAEAEVTFKAPTPALLIPAVLGWVLFFFFLYGITPQPLFQAPVSSVLTDSEGLLLSARTAADGHWRFPALPKLPKRVAQAALQFEDAGFRSHFGFSLPALVRAIRDNWAAGRVVSGGSTITMQTIRLSRGNPDRTYVEKFWEILRSVSLELHYEKNDILSLYLQNAPYGGNVIGVEAASWRYFGRSPDSLSWAEAALLAVLPNSPGLLRLDRNRAQLEAKRNRLLERLASRGLLPADHLATALLEPLPGPPRPLPRHAIHLLEKRAKDGQGRFSSSVDGRIQRKVEGALERRLRILEGDAVSNMAALVLDTKTDDILAYVGNGPDSPDPELGRRVDMILARRSTGSLLKPFLYALAVDDGTIAPRQLLPDIPMRWGGFSPENHSRQFEGAVAAHLALARSRNVPAAWLLSEFGLARFHQTLRDWGMTTLFRSADEYGLTLIIGGAEGRMTDIARMSAALARTALPAGDAGMGGLSGLSRGAAWLTLDALALTIRPGEDRAWHLYADGRKVAWKTGTSQGWRDAWAVGMTPEYTVVVWAGNASGEGRPSLEGSIAAAPLLFDIFRHLPRTSWFPLPVNDLEPRAVNADSGHTASPHSPRTRQDIFPDGSPASPVDPWSRTVHLDAEGRVSDSRFTPIGELRAVPWFVLPPAIEWFHRQFNAAYQPLPPLHPGLLGASATRLAVVHPAEGSRIFIPVELDGRPGRMVVQAAYSGGGTVFWHLDGEFIGQTESEHQMELRPEQGNRKLTLVSQKGDVAERRYTILSRE